MKEKRGDGKKRPEANNSASDSWGNLGDVNFAMNTDNSNCCVFGQSMAVNMILLFLGAGSLLQKWLTFRGR